MQIEAERSLLIKELKMIDDLSIIMKVRAYVNKKMQPKEEEIDIEQYNREYDAIMKRMDAGEFVTHEAAVKRLSNGKRKENSLE